MEIMKEDTKGRNRVMKNIIITIFAVIISLIIGMFIGVNYNNSNETIKDTVRNITTTEIMDNQKFYSKYEVTDLNSTFDKIIRSNSIDKNLNDELKKSSTTQVYIETYNSYVTIWKSELNKSIEMLEKYLNNEEKLKLLELQKNWETLIVENLQFEYDIIKNDEHNIQIGSSFNWLHEKTVMETYRQRTIDIKYLIYFLTYNSKEELKINIEF